MVRCYNNHQFNSTFKITTIKIRIVQNLTNIVRKKEHRPASYMTAYMYMYKFTLVSAFIDEISKVSTPNGG